MRKTEFNKKTYSIIILLLVLTGASFIGGFYYGTEKTGGNSSSARLFAGNYSKPEGVDMTPLWKTWKVLNEKFVPAGTSTEVTTQEKIWGASQGLTNSLNDPYTVFMPPSDNKIFKEDISGNFEGVGMRIGIRDNILTVISPLEGTPASKAGIKNGDKIIKIDGKSTQGMTTDEAVKLIRGEKGTDVVLTIKRKGREELFDISITRNTIEIPTINTRTEEGNVFVIKFHSFNRVSTQKFKKALREFVNSDSNELIIDLRNNPGGYLQAAVETASWFLPTGKVVVKETAGNKEEPKKHRSKGYDIFNDNLKLVILVNEGSASASEIVAGALQDHDKGTVIGGQTFGKGSVQELVDITSDTSLKVTVARWLTPNGRSISENGLKPDIEVEIDEDVKEGEDPRLERALEFLNKNE